MILLTFACLQYSPMQENVRMEDNSKLEGCLVIMESK